MTDETPDLQDVARLRGDAEIDRLRLQAAQNEVDRLHSLVRFQDNVIRSGDVAALTQSEKDAIQTAISEAEAHMHRDRAGTLRGLLERLG